MTLLGSNGARGLSHPRVDQHAGVPAGTTSFYYRTRKALVQAVASRISELDIADLSMLTELAHDDSLGYSGTLGLARLVMLSGTEPYLTRTRARFEVILNARNDPELADIVLAYGVQLYGLAREVIAQWYDGHPEADQLVEPRAMMVMTYISGVMTSFVQGQPVVSDGNELDAMIQHILRT
ncbi:TetR family transcriptional regulator [Mycolicibacterium sp. P1-5]|nr:TetR family transcriptional regulator [Mycolicibacterium sp. P1-5]